MFEFLNKVTVDETMVKTTAPRKGGPKKERNPESGLKIRVFYDGSVYPSQELVDKFNLEYSNRPEEVEGKKTPTIGGFGFDVIDSKLFPAFKGIPEGQRVLFIAPVMKSAAKVDLFGTTNYNDDNTPKASVLSQGNKTFGADSFIPMLEAAYGVGLKKLVSKPIDQGNGSVGEEESYDDGLESIDLEFIANPSTDQPWEMKVAFIPKTVSRGKDKGTVTTTRRENVNLYVLAPVAAPVAEAKSDAKLSVDKSVTK